MAKAKTDPGFYQIELTLQPTEQKRQNYVSRAPSATRHTHICNVIGEYSMKQSLFAWNSLGGNNVAKLKTTIQ